MHLSLIHYHFQSRDGLLLALLKDMTADLTTRQRQMYARTDLSLADKWREAIEFYRHDLASGYVRAVHELITQGYSNPAIAREVRALNAAWIGILADVAADAMRRLNLTDLEPQEVAAMVAAYWTGMEVHHLIEASEEEIPLWQATERIGTLIERLERRTK